MSWPGLLGWSGAATSRAVAAHRLVGEADDNVVLARAPAALADLDALSRVASAVGSVRVDDRPVATGFLLDDGRFVTCHHVLPTRAVAARAAVVFERYVRGETAARVVCAVDAATFRTRAAADVTVVALRAEAPLPAGLRAGEGVEAGDEVAMVHRPGGGRVIVSSRWKRVSLVLRGRAEVRYDLDTHNGSSGAPVFDRAWRVVAVHRDAGPLREDGRAFYNHGALIGALPRAAPNQGERR